jgi:hypothetical protein
MFEFPSKKCSKPFVKIRTSKHHLPIEVCRWYGISLFDRTCTFCNTGKLDVGESIYDQKMSTSKKLQVNIYWCYFVIYAPEYILYKIG